MKTINAVLFTFSGICTGVFFLINSVCSELGVVSFIITFCLSFFFVSISVILSNEILKRSRTRNIDKAKRAFIFFMITYVVISFVVFLAMRYRERGLLYRYNVFLYSAGLLGLIIYQVKMIFCVLKIRKNERSLLQKELFVNEKGDVYNYNKR